MLRYQYPLSLKPNSHSTPGNFLQWDATANGGIGAFINTPAPVAGSPGSVSGHVIQVIDNQQMGGEALTMTGYSNKCWAVITISSDNSKIAFYTSGSPFINGIGYLYLHWRSRNSLSDPWGSYQDTGKVMMKLSDLSSFLETRDSAIGVHSPNLLSGSQVEYRMYFEQVVGTLYYPDPNVTTAITNLVLQEIAA